MKKKRTAMAEFSNPELHKVHMENKHVFEEHLERMNELSRDIKEVEEFLRTNAHPQCGFAYQDFLLNWFDNRLCYRDNNTKSKPLIETKLHIRILCQPYLKQFLKDALNLKV